jgi:drug/metabolite transporter (DMT)-like permease
MYVLYLSAYAHLGAHQIALFTVFTPIYVVLWSDLRERRIRPLGLLCAALAVGGAALLSERDLGSGDLLRGFALVQAANLCFAVGQIEYRRLRIRRPELRDRQAHVLVLVGGLVITGIATTLRGGWPGLAELDAPAIAALAYLGLIASGVGFFAWNAGAVRTPPATLAVMNNLKVPLGIAAALLFFGEETDLPRLLLGGSIMLGAAWLSQRAARSASPSAKLREPPR